MVGMLQNSCVQDLSHQRNFFTNWRYEDLHTIEQLTKSSSSDRRALEQSWGELVERYTTTELTKNSDS